VFLAEWFQADFCRGPQPVGTPRRLSQQAWYQRIRPSCPTADRSRSRRQGFRRRSGAAGRVHALERPKSWTMLQKWLTVEPLWPPNDLERPWFGGKSRCARLRTELSPNRQSAQICAARASAV